MRVAVLGAGTMGAGIAQVALQGGHAVALYDVSEAMLMRGLSSIEGGLAKLVDKGRLEASARDAALERLQLTGSLDDLAESQLVIEAAPETMAIKQDLFRYLDGLCAPETVLASNTSSLSITAIAACTKLPGRVVGLHFFNPAPLMALVEVVAGQLTDEATLAAALAFVESLGKTAVSCKDTPGFIVNRVARPFYGEALKILGEGGASLAAIDASLKAGGFRMGPFELMDLIGIDVNFAVTQSVYQAFFGEPRFRPHPIQQRMVHAGRLGRKSGQGFYDYPAGPNAPAACAPARGLKVAVVGPAPVLVRWGAALAQQEHELVAIDATGGLLDGSLLPELGEVAGVFEAFDAVGPARHALQQQLAERLAPTAWLVSTDLTRTATALATAIGHPAAVLGDWAGGSGPWELAVAEGTSAELADRLQAAACALGAPAVRVADHLGGVFARVLAMLVNEASFALQEGVASAEDIDRALKLGANYPHGPLAWGDSLGSRRIVALLDALHAELGEERYRVSPLLRRHALVFPALVFPLPAGEGRLAAVQADGLGEGR